MGTRLKVLVLEDRPSDAELMVDELRRAGFDPEWRRVETETDYLAALDPALDVILADYTLPQFDALRALQLLQARGLEIPFLVVTGSIGEEAAVECMKRGAADYLLKDRLARLGSAVAQTLEEKQLQEARRQAEEALVRRTGQLEAVRAVSEEIARELDLTSLLELIVRKAVELVGGFSGLVALWEEGGRQLRPRAWHGLGDWVGDLRWGPGDHVVGAVVQRGVGMIVNDYRTSPYAFPTALHRTAVTAVLAEPLWYRGCLIGVITCNRDDPDRPFTEQDRETLALFATQAAIAIENARLHGAAVRQGEELSALLRATRTVMAGLDLRETLDRIVTEAAQITGIPHVKVLLADQEAQVLRLGAVVGRPPALLESFRMPWGMGSSGIVAATGQPLYVPNCPDDTRNVYADQDRELGILTYLGLPIKSRDEVLGVLTFNTTEPRQYSPAEVTYLASFADQAAIAIENARLYEAIRRQAAELEERVQARTAELAAALEVKTQFLANMSHEMRTPLNAVLGFSEILLGGGPGDLTPKQERYLQLIQGGGKRLLELVTDVLSMAEAQNGAPALSRGYVTVDQLVEEVLESLSPTARAKQVALEAAVEPALPALVADRRKLAQVLHHLVANAVKFTPSGGAVRVTARIADCPRLPSDGGQGLAIADLTNEDTDLQSQIANRKSQMLEIAVSDTGVGIAAGDLERIFEPFEQADYSSARHYQGAGLGLALARKLVELHGGRIWATSEGEGRGSTFTVALPFEGPRDRGTE